MSKLTLGTISNLLNSSAITTLNNNFAAVVVAVENTLSRNGTSPNFMQSNLDMNSNRILNLPKATSPNEPVRKQEFDAAVFAAGGGTTSGGGDMLSTHNLSDVANVTTARSNLGLGTAATAAATSFASASHTHTSSQITDFSTASADAVNSALVAGSNIALSYNAGTHKMTISATSTSGGDMLSTNNLSDLANKTTARTNLGVAIGTNVQAYDAKLTSIAGLTGAADTLPYFTGTTTAATTSLTSFSRTLLAAASASTALSTLGGATAGLLTSSGLTMSTSRLLGRTSATTGAVEEISIGTGLSLTSGVLSNTGSGLVVGTSGITSGSSGKVLYDNGGLLGEKATTGSGNVVLDTSPTLTTPVLGTPASGNLANCNGLPLTNTTGTLAVGRGGIGQTTLTTGAVLVGAGTSGITSISPGTSGNVLQSNGTNWVSQALSVSGVTGVYQPTAFTGAAIQAAITSASTNGGIVALQPGTYTCTSSSDQITIASGVQVVGLGRNNYSPLSNGTVSGGAIIDIQWGNGTGHAGNPTYAAVILKSGAGISNVAFTYSGQASSSTVAPTEYGSTVQINDTGGNYNQYVQDCFFMRSYIAIDFRGSKCSTSALVAGAKIERNTGCPLFIGIAMDYQADWVVVANNHFNSPFANGLNYSSGVSVWTQANGYGIFVGGCDWINLVNNQIFGYSNGVRIYGTSGYAGSGPYTVTSCNFDGCLYGIYIMGTVNFPIQITACNFAPYDAATSSPGAAIINDASTTVIKGLIVSNCYAFGNFNWFVYLNQTYQTSGSSSNTANINITNNIASSYSSAGTACTFYSGNNIMVQNNVLHGFAAGVSFGSGTNTVTANNQT